MPREPPNTNAIFLLITLPLSLSAYRDGHDTLFGHFTNGVARPLAPETAVLGAPVGHEVDTGARGFVDMNAAHLQAPGSVERSEKSRVGKACDSTCRSRWTP